MMNHNLTKGNITKTMLYFAFPMIIGNLLQQLYNIVDTLIVGRYLGVKALAAVGSSFTLMTFLTSMLLGLCMGSGTAFAIYYGGHNVKKLKSSIFVSFVFIGAFTILLNTLVYIWIDPMMRLLQVPQEIYPIMRQYLLVIFIGISATFLYNFVASLLRAMGNALIPLLFLMVSAVLNILLDFAFVIGVKWGVAGAAFATVIAQFVAGIGILIYAICKFPYLRLYREDMHLSKAMILEIFQLSMLTCVQQSVMNFGILIVQGLINSFGTIVMAAFAAAVKIDSLAYMPVQDFGNAFSTFIAQNYGAKKYERIRKGIKCAVGVSTFFCIIISIGVCIFAKPLMGIFIKDSEVDIIAVGVQYLRIEGVFYIGIGFLFLLYGFFRAVRRPGISVMLTMISLGTRVILAYTLSSISAIGVVGIWWAVPIGWILADIVGFLCYRKGRDNIYGNMITKSNAH